MKTNLKTRLVAEICLYGTHTHGAGWLARTADGKLLGDGELRQGRTFTSAVWLACEEIRKAGVQKGSVRVFAAGGKMMADTDLNRPATVGDMKWEPATVVVISCEAIEAAAEKVA